MRLLRTHVGWDLEADITCKQHSDRDVEFGSLKIQILWQSFKTSRRQCVSIKVVEYCLYVSRVSPIIP